MKSYFTLLKNEVKLNIRDMNMCCLLYLCRLSFL